MYRIYRDRNLMKYSDIPSIACWISFMLSDFRKVLKKILQMHPGLRARHGCCLRRSTRAKSESGEDEYWRTVRAVQKQPRCKFFTTQSPPHTEGGAFVERAPSFKKGCFRWHFGMSIPYLPQLSIWSVAFKKKQPRFDPRHVSRPHFGGGTCFPDFQVLHCTGAELQAIKKILQRSDSIHASGIFVENCRFWLIIWKITWIPEFCLVILGGNFLLNYHFFGDFIWRSYRFPRNDGVQSMKSAFNEKSGWPWQWHLKMMGPI